MMNETPDIDQYWQALEAVLPTFAEDEQRAAVTLYRELAKGSPVSATQLPAALDVPVASAEDLLGRDFIRSFVYPDEEGHVLGFGGLAAAPMSHKLDLDGRTLWTWCAWDSLFIPEILGEQAQVESRDPPDRGYHPTPRSRPKVFRIFRPRPVPGLDETPEGVGRQENPAVLVAGFGGPIQHGPEEPEVVLDLAIANWRHSLPTLPDSGGLGHRSVWPDLSHSLSPDECVPVPEIEGLRLPPFREQFLEDRRGTVVMPALAGALVRRFRSKVPVDELVNRRRRVLRVCLGMFAALCERRCDLIRCLFGLLPVPMPKGSSLAVGRATVRRCLVPLDEKESAAALLERPNPVPPALAGDVAPVLLPTRHGLRPPARRSHGGRQRSWPWEVRRRHTFHLASPAYVEDSGAGCAGRWPDRRWGPGPLASVAGLAE